MTDASFAPEPWKVQGSKAWHAWRATGLGSSDAPVIMNSSPFATPFQRWEERVGIKKSQSIPTFVQERGHRLEKIARRKYEEITGKKFPPDCFENGIFLASLDGWNEELGRIAEIKAPTYIEHLEACQGKVSEKYDWQLVHQAITLGEKVKSIDYVSYHVEEDQDEEDGDLQIVNFPLPSVKTKAKYIKEAKKFFTCIQTNTPPPFTERDFVPIKKSKDLEKLYKKFLHLSEQKKMIEAEYDGCRHQIMDFVKEKDLSRIKFERLRVQLVRKKGNIDAHKMAVANDIDIEKFRKPPSSYMMVSLAKENADND